MLAAHRPVNLLSSKPEVSTNAPCDVFPKGRYTGTAWIQTTLHLQGSGRIVWVAGFKTTPVRKRSFTGHKPSRMLIPGLSGDLTPLSVFTKNLHKRPLFYFCFSRVSAVLNRCFKSLLAAYRLP